MTDAQLQADLTKVEGALAKVLGIRPALFRPPYGAYTQKSLNTAAAKGYQTILWSFDSEDSLGATTAQSQAAYVGL